MITFSKKAVADSSVPNKKNNNNEKSKADKGKSFNILKKNGENRFAPLESAVPPLTGQEELISWADSCDKGGGGATTFNKDGAEEIIMFSLLNGEAPFLVGVKGRNISLIRKFSGMAIFIKNDVVSMIPQRSSADPDLAWRMVLSACYGGILRWFDTPNATKKGYPDDKTGVFEALASSYDASIDLLRSKRGHMCLMLIPVMSIVGKPTTSDIATVKAKLLEARHTLLEALQPGPAVG